MTKPNPQQPGSALPLMVCEQWEDGLLWKNVVLSAAPRNVLFRKEYWLGDASGADLIPDKMLLDEIVHACNAYPALARKLEEARAALEFYAARGTHESLGKGPNGGSMNKPITNDRGTIARRALAQMEQG